MKTEINILKENLRGSLRALSQVDRNVFLGNDVAYTMAALSQMTNVVADARALLAVLDAEDK